MTDKFTHPDDAEEGHQWVIKGGVLDGKKPSTVSGLPTMTIAVVDGSIEIFTLEGLSFFFNQTRLVDAPRKHVEGQFDK
jgi:hypothetical protein